MAKSEDADRELADLDRELSQRAATPASQEGESATPKHHIFNVILGLDALNGCLGPYDVLALELASTECRTASNRVLPSFLRPPNGVPQNDQHRRIVCFLLQYLKLES